MNEQDGLQIAGSASCEGCPSVEQSIAARFEDVAAQYPDRTAVESRDSRLSYSQLNSAANQLAHRLLTRSGAPGDRVALLLPHDAPLVAAILAVLKAGRTVVVLTPDDPPDRLSQVLNDAEPCQIVTDGSHWELVTKIAAASCELISLEEQSASLAHNPQVEIAPEALAFLIYTSGSTGRPKGVMQTHRNMLHNVRRLTRGMGICPSDRCALLAALSGGQGLATLQCGLLNGATICFYPVMERGIVGLAAWMLDRKVTVYVSAASLFRMLIATLNADARFPDVRLLRLGAEVATSDDFAAWAKHFPSDGILLHTLSSTETGNITQCQLTHHQSVQPGSLPVGTATDDTEIVLVDDQGQRVPDGQPGEIVVRSRYLSPGYWRNESLTCERFNGESGGLRTFRSSDLACRARDGSLMFLGRKDHQVKIRGNRVEISEIENVLARQPGVESAVVCVRKQHSNDQLVAYIARRNCPDGFEADLRSALHVALPRFMEPAHFVFLKSFPRTPNGKIDREQLRQMSLPIRLQTSIEEPAAEVETLLKEIWSEVFGHSAIGRRDDFFHLGGDSLLAAVVAARVHTTYGVELDLRAFADHPVLADLASVIDDLRGAVPLCQSPQLERVSRNAALPLSFFQERIWKYSQTPQDSLSYSVACSYRLRGKLDIDVLRRSMNYVVRRHEMLRTTFETVDGQPVQIIHPAEPVSLPVVELADGTDAPTQAKQLLREQARQPFDLARGPLLRFWLMRVTSNEHWLLRVNHHIVSDAWSWQVFFRELKLVYEPLLRGDVPELPDFEPLQYCDYAAWQRRVLQPNGSRYRQTVQWWMDLFASQPVPLQLPCARQKPMQGVEPADGSILWGIDRNVSRRLDELGRAAGATYFVTRLAAFAAVLAAETAQSEVVLGTYVTNRNRVETQGMFGCFANLTTLVLRPDLNGTFRELVCRVRDNVAETQANSDIPYERLCEELCQRGVTPLEIRAIFSVSERIEAVSFGDAELSWLDRRVENMPWGFSMNLDRQNDERRCEAIFDPRIHEPAGVRRLIAHYAAFLDVASRNPDESARHLLTLVESPSALAAA